MSALDPIGRADRLRSWCSSNSASASIEPQTNHTVPQTTGCPPHIWIRRAPEENVGRELLSP